MPFPVNLGAIDAGSNAIRVVVGTALNAEDIKKVASERVPVRLGHGAFTRGELDAPTIDAAVVAFRRFRELFDQHGVTHYRAVATSALRDAHNSDVLLHSIYHEAGIELEIIDGEEEARLVRRAVQQACADNDASPPHTIIDLGGGSLEVNIRQGPRWNVASLPIGTVRLMEGFELYGAIDTKGASVIRRNVTALLRTVVPRGSEGLAPAAACGGNAEQLADLFGKPRNGMPSFKEKDLDKALPELLAMNVEQRIERYGVRQDRAEVMGIAALVLAECCKYLGVPRMYVPNVGIREALLLERAEAAETDAHHEKARRHTLLASARTFANRCGHDTTHSEHVRRHAHVLFGELRDLHQLRPELSSVLEVAALLHDVGVVVNGSGHHKHGEYMILNGRIPGLESPEREMVAALVRAHRKSPPTPDKHETFARLSPDHQAEVARLTALLRLADSLDHDHRQSVRRVRARTSDHTVQLDLEVRAGMEPPEPMADKKLEWFQQLFARDIQVAFLEPS